MSAPALNHPILKSLSEVQSEREELIVLCDECGDPLDEDRYKQKICLDCQSEAQKAQRKAYEREYGSVEWEDMRAGRGFPRD